jgi:cell filamentation protein
MANAYTDETGVFKNKLGISDPSLLEKMEYELVAQRAIELDSGEIELDVEGFGLARQQAIHKHLFQDIYEWAGQVRTVPSSKRMANRLQSRFAAPETIGPKWATLERKTSAFTANPSLSFEQKQSMLADIFIEANHIHAFPEGNGRSLQIFMKQLAQEQGVALDYTKVMPDDWNMACAVSGEHGRLFEHTHFIASESDVGPIKRIFASIAKPL